MQDYTGYFRFLFQTGISIGLNLTERTFTRKRYFWIDITDFRNVVEKLSSLK